MADVDGLLTAVASGSLEGVESALAAGVSPDAVNRSSFVSSVFCSGVIDAERRRWRAPEKLRLIAAISYCARAATAYL